MGDVLRAVAYFCESGEVHFFPALPTSVDLKQQRVARAVRHSVAIEGHGSRAGALVLQGAGACS